MASCPTTSTPSWPAPSAPPSCSSARDRPAARTPSSSATTCARPAPELVAAFAAGATGQGVDVVEIGLAATDELYFASGRLDLPGAMFTASHNPAQYNGIKLCRAGRRPGRAGHRPAPRSATWSQGFLVGGLPARTSGPAR